MTFGPTQNYDDPGLDRWRPRPVLAAGVKAAIYLLPPVLAISLGWAAARFLPASRLGINPWVWLVAEVAISTGAILLLGRVTRRLLPLSTMLTMALVFPDQAPSRLSLAVRTHSPAALRRRVEEVQRTGRMPRTEEAHATELLGLVAALSLHDHATRGHSERVQGYASMLAEELKLNEHDTIRLSWAALLHDIGKLQVPAEILNKDGRPTESEWRVLATHPHAGLTLAAPLADFLGDWIDAIGQHHERWDGKGYPMGIAGERIHYGARIIAVADTFDVITSARSYKAAMPASRARAELARCAGTQFDPEVVRAFLAIGLGKLRPNAGPLSALSGLPGIRSVPLPDLAAAANGLGSVLTSGSAAATAALGLLVGAVAAPAVSAERADDSAAVVRDADVTAQPSGTSVASPRPGDVPPQDNTGADGEELDADDAGSATGLSADGTPSGSDPTAAPAETAGTTPERSTTTAPSTKTSDDSSTKATQDSSAKGSQDSTAKGNGCTEVQRSELGACSLAGATLVGDWTGANLRGTDLTGATLDGVDLSDAVLSGADLSGATLHDVQLDGAKLLGTDLSDASLDRVDLRGADLTNASLAGAEITDSVFGDAVLLNASLLDAVAHDSVDLTGALLQEADLTGARLPGIDLTDADLTGAELVGTDLTGATLTGATLVRADLTDALLIGVSLGGADLSRADLEGTSFWLATGTPAGTTKATFADTVCPPGTTASTSCWG